MDDLDRLRNLLPEQPPPDRRTQTKARARLLKLAGESRRRPARRTAIRLSAAAVAAVAVLALLLGPVYFSGVLDGPDGSQALDPLATASNSATSSSVTSARTVLLGAARQLDNLKPEPLGAFWHQRSLLSVPYVVGTKATYQVESWLVQESWVSQAAPTSWTGSCALGTRPRSPGDTAAWKRDGSPEYWGGGSKDAPMLVMKPGQCRMDGGGSGFVLGEDRGVDYHTLESVPADVGTLRTFLLDNRPSEAGDPDRWLFSAASALLTDLPVSPQVRAAAFRLLAGLPGVVSQGTVQDSLGRKGTAIALVDERRDFESTLQLVVDPATGKLLSRRLNATTADGKPVKRATVVYLSVGWTNLKPGPPSPKVK